MADTKTLIANAVRRIDEADAAATYDIEDAPDEDAPERADLAPLAPQADGAFEPRLIYSNKYLRAVRAKTRSAIEDAEAADAPTHVRLVQNLRDLFGDEDYQRIATSFLVHQIRLLPDDIEKAGIDLVYDFAQNALVDTFDYLLTVIDDK